jgi:hypothetical protein
LSALAAGRDSSQRSAIDSAALREQERVQATKTPSRIIGNDHASQREIADAGENMAAVY